MKDRELSIGQHLGELRRRLLFSVLILVATTVLSFIFYRQIIQALLVPAKGLGGFEGDGARLVFIDLTEMFAVTMKVSLISGLVLAFPVVLYQVVLFVAPGLRPRERRYLFTFLPGALLAFAAGVAFGYFVLIPPAVHFLLRFGSELATPMIRISSYVNLVVMLLFWIGLAFETPVVMFILARLRVVSPKAFSRFRRYWVLVAFVLGAVITPTFDPINQSLVAGPLIVLYEVGIWLSKLAVRGQGRTYPEVAKVPGP